MSNVARTGDDDRNNATSPTRFGHSVESQAQQSDVAKRADGFEGEALNIYRLVPLADADDPRWDNAGSHGEVVVAALTAGDARIVAASRELDYTEIDSAPAEDVSTAFASAFRSDKLYGVVEIERGRRDLKRGILSGEVSVDTVRPVQV